MSNFIGRREILAGIDTLLNSKEGFIYAVKGNPGMGKSTLLKQVAELNSDEGQLFLDLNDLPPLQTAVEFLQFAAERTTGLKHTQKALAKIKGTYQSAGDLIKPYEKILNKTATLGLNELGNDLSPEEKGKVSSITKILLELGTILYSRFKGNEKTKLGDPELFLLNAFKQDCHGQPLFFIDTYERLQAANIISEQKIAANYSRPHEFLKPSQANIKLQDWLERFLAFLQANGARVFVAGRKAGCWESKAQAVERFSSDEILEFVATSENPQIQQAREEEPGALLQVLTKLSFGGIPLWLSLAVNFVEIALQEGETLSALAANKSIHDFFEKIETDSDLETANTDHANCKLALFNRVMQHNLDISEHAWKMALPRRIDPDCLKILFAEQGGAIRQAFVKAGLCLVNRLKEPDTIRLHDEIRDLLRAYANHKGWLKTEQVGAMHQQLEQFYQDKYRHSGLMQHLLEQLYHQVMQTGDLRLEQIIDQKLLYDMAFELQNESQFSKMAQVCLRWIELEPESDSAYFGLGFALGQQGKLDEEIAAYRQQVEVKPDHQSAWYNLGIALGQQGNLDEAIAAYRKQLEVKPDHQNAWNNLGVAFMKQGEWVQAQSCYENSLKIEPDDVSALANDAELALIQNDKARCLRRANQCLQLIDHKRQEFVILPFLMWLAEPEQSTANILQAIGQFEPGTEITWDFSDVEPPVIQRLEPEQQVTARRFIDYFTGKISAGELAANAL